MEPTQKLQKTPVQGDLSTRSIQAQEPTATVSVPPTVDADPAVKGAFHQRRLGRFQLLRLLGAGSFGEVYLAQDPQLQRQVALKIARPHRLGDMADFERFFREARAAAQFKHPHIVPVFEVGQEGKSPYIVSAFIEGESLAERLERQRYSIKEAVVLIGQLADAVHYAHQKGVFHRDLKPGNVMIDSQGASHLMDFGLARRLEGEELQTQEGDVIGTPAYMSPEQARGEGHAVDARSDLYSLGVVLYELLAGRRPFSGSVFDVIRQVQVAEPLSPRRWDTKISRDLEAICLKAMAKRPDDRYPSVLHFAEDLGRWQSNRPVEARRISLTARAGKWMRRHPLSSIAIAVVISSAAAILAYFQTRPAWLDVRITPAVAGAEVQLDGEPIELNSEGRALISRAPGRRRLSVSAASYLPAEREVMLVRGKENAALATVELTTAFGYSQVTSDPEGAAVELVSDKAQSVAHGVTPFNSPRLPSGKYTVRISKELYKPIETALEVPNGDRLISSPIAKLEPLLENASSFEFIRTVRRRFAQEVTFEADEMPLLDAVAELSKLAGIGIVVSPRSLQKAGISARTPVTIDSRGLPLNTVLDRILTPLQLTYRPERNGESQWIVVIGNAHEAGSRLWTVVYHVADVVQIRGSAVKDYQSLIDSLTSLIAPASWNYAGGPGSITWHNQTTSLIVSQTWDVHRDIDNFLVNLREARLAKAPDPKDMTQELQNLSAAVQRIGTLGGTVKQNEYHPGFPIEVIDLKNGKATEIDLEQVALFPRLKRLDVSNCVVRGDFLDKLPADGNLSQLLASRTRFDDATTAKLVRLSKLTYLDLGYSRVTDAGMVHVADLPRLTNLHIPRTAVTDAGVARLKKLPSLYELNLSGAAITDDAAKEMAQMPALQQIWLHVSPITDLSLEHLAKKDSLTLLSLYRTKISDRGVGAIASMKGLRQLNLSCTMITDSGLESLKVSSDLWLVNASHTAVTDKGLPPLSGLPLRILNLEGTSITDDGLSSLAKMQSLVQIYLRDTKTTPAGIAQLQKSLPRTQIFSGATASKK
jgi:tRNA A-37 threonylcarbamoyl transferase component Bud32/Leucine-rich repeat (LRR) protein